MYDDDDDVSRLITRIISRLMISTCCHVSQVCSVCGLHAGFHLDQSQDDRAQDEIDSARYDSASERSSEDQQLNQYEHDGDGDMTASLAAVVPRVVVATDNEVGELDSAGNHLTSNRDEAPPTPMQAEEKHSSLIPGTVYLIIKVVVY